MRRFRAAFVPSIILDPVGPLPLRRQLYEWFRQAIADGRLRPGQRVPSTRSLAEELRVSRITVVAAYEQLQAEGYLQSFPGAGACIAATISESVIVRRMPPADAGRRPACRRLSRRAGHLMALPEECQLAVAGAFRVSLPALDRFPGGTWSRLVARHVRHSSAEDAFYGDSMGDPGFRMAIAEYLGAVRAVRCDATQVMVTAGSQQGLLIALHALLDAGDAVWVEEPGYAGAHRALVIAGCQPVAVPTDAEGLDVDAGVRRCAAARAAYVTPSHQYPLGVTMTAGRRIQLLNWASRAGAWILEDDYDSEFRFAGHPIASLQGLDRDDRVIYIGTLSKVLFPALRMGYLVVPKDLVRVLRATREAIDITPPVHFQRAVADLIREGHFARHIRRMRALYRERRERMITSLERELRDGFEIVSAEAGLHLVLRLPAGMDDKALAEQVNAAGIACVALSVCCLEPSARGGLVLGYGGVDVARIDEAVRRLGKIARAARR